MNTRVVNYSISIIMDILITFAVFLVTGSKVVAGKFFIVASLNVFGLPLIFLFDLPLWSIYVIVVFWIYEIVWVSKGGD